MVLCTVPGPSAGQVTVSARPRGHDLLGGDLAELASHGVEVLVSTLTSHDQELLGLSHEPEAAPAAGLGFVALPLEESGLAGLPTALPRLRELAASVRDDAHVAVHCRFGLGRAFLVAAALLVLAGADPLAVWPRLEAARGLPLVDGPAREAWTARVAEAAHEDALAAPGGC